MKQFVSHMWYITLSPLKVILLSIGFCMALLKHYTPEFYLKAPNISVKKKKSFLFMGSFLLHSFILNERDSKLFSTFSGVLGNSKK